MKKPYRCQNVHTVCYGYYYYIINKLKMIPQLVLHASSTCMLE